MKKSTKKLLTLALSTLFVGAGLGGAVAAYDAFDAKVAAAETVSAVNLADGASKGNWNNGEAFASCWMYRIWLPKGAWTSSTCISDTNLANTSALRDNLKINGKSINEWITAYKAGETAQITWPEIADAPQAWGSILDRIGAFTFGDHYAPIDATLCYHGGGNANSLDIYVAKSMFPAGINSIELTADFEFVNGETTYNFGNGVTYYGNSFGYAGTEKATVEAVPTTVTKAYHTDSNGGALYFYLGTHDYPETVGDYVLPAKVAGYNDFLKQINYYDYIELDGQKLGFALKENQGETFINVWGRKGTYSIRWPSSWSETDRANLQEIKILKGAQFPSYENTLGKVFEVQEDIVLRRGADGEFNVVGETPDTPVVPDEPEVPELTNVDVTNIAAHGQWGTGDYKGNMAHIRLNIAGEVTWAEAGKAVSNPSLPATVLDNVLINGKSISQHNAEYKALIESEEKSPITWDASIAFNSEIASDVNNGTAVYAPIYIKLVNHGAGLAGNTIDIYIPNSYLSASDITELKITKDFCFETATAKFTVSDNVIFKTNSLRKPIKYIGQAPEYNLNIQETTVEKIDGSHLDGDAFLSFYLSNSDYATAQTPWSGSLEFLKNINYFDYILIDGVKIGELWNYVEPGEIFMNVWNRPGSFGTRWPNGINNTAGKSGAKEITILAGCQFPSMLDTTGTVYQVNETMTFKATEGGVFVNEKYLLDAEDITITQATDVGDALEMIAFEISYANWNSTRDTYDFNYFGDQFTAMRKHIFINGVSLWDINTTVDDSGYNYVTSPWSNGDAVSGSYQIFQNPTLVRGEGNKLTIYVHKDYLNAKGINELTVTVGKNFTHSETPVYVVGEDITEKVWTRPMTVTFNTNGGSAIDAMTVPYGTPASALATVPAPTKEGYTFAGWTLGGYPIPADATVLQDLTIDANWTIINYSAKIVRADGTEETVTFNVEDRADKLAAIALTANSAQYSYAWAEALPSELALQDGYVFTETRTINNYTITFDVDGGSAINAMTVPYGTPAAALAQVSTAKEGYTFAGWTLGGYAIPADAIVESDLTVKANWTIINYTATINRADGTTETVEFNVENRADKLAAIALTENTEYYTYSWAEELPTELELKDGYVFTELKETATYTISLVKSMWDMPEELVLEYGAALELEQLTAEGKIFKGWFSFEYDDEWNEIMIPAPATVTGDLTLHAVWEVIPYTVTLVENGNVVKEIKFGIEYAENVDTDIMGLAYTLTDVAPADTRYSYQFVDALPEEFTEFKDYQFEVKTVLAPQEYQTFKMSLMQGTNSKLLYLDGGISGRYLTMTEDAMAAIDMVAEKTESGYKFYTEANGEYLYLNIYFNDENKISVNYALEEECSYYVFNYNAETNCWYTDVNGTDYYLGTYSNFNTVSASKTSYITSENTGDSQFPLEIVQTYQVTIKYSDNWEDPNWMKVMNVVDGTVITLETPAAEGKEFLGWTDIDGNELLETTYTVNGEGFAAYAKWNIFTYNFTVIMGEETSEYIFAVESDWMTGALSREEMLNELTWLLPETTDTMSYKWDIELPEVLELKDYTVTLVAEERIYEVALIIDRWAIPETVSGKYGEAITLPTPTAEGKVFAGWIDLEGNAITEATFSADIQALYATWTITPYTLTIVNGDETTVITFGVMADPTNGVEAEVMSLGFILGNLLPADTDAYTYAWAEEIPAEFGLQNYTFTVVATAVEQPGTPVDPEQPGTSEDPEEPGTSEEPEEPGSSEEPEEPGTSEEPSASEEPSILDKVKGMIPGCSGVVGGIAGGVAALGIAAVALLKKKEDNE